uniref:Zinc finger protein 345-like n=1 Tax=Poecilia latipinna TaxID=48699 RepID=A0A3B3TNM7_9TELE
MKHLRTVEETFDRQTELVLQLLLEAAVEVLLGQREPVTEEVLLEKQEPKEKRNQLSSVLVLMSREAVRKIRSIFRELYLTVLTENEALKDKVRRLEGEEPQKPKPSTAVKNHKAPKVRSLVLDPSVRVAELQVVSVRPTCSDPVPEIFTHLSAQQPIGRQNSCCVEVLQEKTDLVAPGSPQVEAEVVLETTQISTEPETKDGLANGLPGGDQVQPEGEGTMGSETTEEPESGSEGLTGLQSPTAASAEQQKEQERCRRRELYKEKRFFCELCNKGFHQNHQLTKHMASHRKPFPCDACDKGFYKAHMLLKHQQSHQLREAQERDPDKLLQCDQCSRKFRLLRQLRVHQASHRLEKTPLECHACDRTFTSAAALRSHEVSHAKVKPFMCDVCGKSFTRKKSLQEHQRVHTGARPYPCQTCGKRFSTSGNLRVHKRSHSDERPYKCSECDKAFKCRMGLMQHRVVHSGEKPHQVSSVW